MNKPDFYALQRIVASDAKGRGAASLCRAEFWADALRLCVEAERVSIVTGFYIPGFGAPETDGPPGAAVLGRALARLGKRVVLFTDDRNYDCLKACIRSLSADVIVAAAYGPADILAAPRMDLLIFIERPGHAADGRYYSMRSMDISEFAAPLDRAAEPALRRGVPVLAIGDGGNEAGMGLLYEPLAALLPDYAPCLSIVPSTVCLPVDVSNLGAYALTAALSLSCGSWLGLNEGEETAMLDALAAAGAVDGILGKTGRAGGVDGFSADELDAVSLCIRNWYIKELGGIV